MLSSTISGLIAAHSITITFNNMVLYKLPFCCLVCRLIEVGDAIVDLRSQQERDKQEFRALEQEITNRCGSAE